MGVLSVRVPDSLQLKIKKMAAERRVDESTMWRAAIERGINSEEVNEVITSAFAGMSGNLNALIMDEMSRIRDSLRKEVLGDLSRIVVEVLCLNRRMAGEQRGGDEVIRKAREDAKAILEQLEIN